MLTGQGRDGKVVGLRADLDSKALSVIDSVHEAIHDGRAFSTSVSTSAAANGSGAFYFYAQASYEPHFRVDSISTSGPAKFTLYRYNTSGNASATTFCASGYSASANLTNRDQLSYMNASSHLRLLTGSGGFATTSATQLDYWSMGTASGGVRIGGSSSVDSEWELHDDWCYAIHWVSLVADNLINVKIFEYEYDYDG